MKIEVKATDLIKESRAFIALPNDQANGFFSPSSPDAPCCVGARLAQFMSVPSTSYFYDGIDAFAAALGCTRAHLILMLRAAGAPQHPFSSTAWETTPVDVWDKLAAMEEFPPLAYADLRHADLFQIDLSEAILLHANLRGADLRDTDLSGADLYYADLRKADLRGADLRKADLRKADLRKADLRGADLRDADLRDAEM